MKDDIEDLSQGGVTARVNWSHVNRVRRAKRQRGEIIHQVTQWTATEAQLNAKFQEDRRRRISGESEQA